LTSAATIPLNQWTHVAITLDSSSGVRRQRIYINGVQDANTNNWQGTLSTNNCRVHIGGDVDTGSCNVIPGRNFNGMIDEVKLYGFELTQAQVQADMNLGRNCSGSFDHIRIEHDGIGSICAPESVTIKACLDPDCTTLFPGDVTVNLSPSGWVGGNSFMFSGGIASRQLSRGTSGDVTLGTNSVSPTPSSSTQCFNGSTQTCTLNFADVSCAFDAVEPGYSPQSPIFTKLSGVPFDIDVLALLDASTVNTNYVNTVDVDLVDSASSACPAGAGLTTAASLDFVPGDAGRKTVTFDYPGAARNVKVRTRIGASAPACSNDNFAIRPQSFNITSTDATNTATDGTPTIAAGSTFNLTAQALAGYDGTPSVDASLVTGSPNMGTLSGNFNAAAIGSGTASGDFNYSEVGHFGLSENAVYDDDFTLVDHPDDCTNDFSNTLSGGKYGCHIGSPEIPITVGSSGSGFGRFVPDHFVTSVLYNGVFADACSGFTYTGQSFSYDPTSHHPQLEIRAVNSLGATTVNYQGDYVKLTDPATQIDMPPVTSDATQFGADASLVNLIWAPGASALVANGDGTVTFTLGNDQFTYVRDANSLIAPFTSDIRLPINSVTDDDGVSANDLPRSFTPGTTHIRYGRLLLQNAYGPETMDLTIPVLTEYYDGTAFLPNASDNCTPYNASNLLFGVYQAPLAPGDTVASGDGTFVSGTSNNIGTNSFLTLSAPVDGHTGSVELIYDLDAAGLSWLKPGGNNPRAIATFGVFQGNSRLIYMRESIW
jgi:MSHA biogenesis protein MshQ